MVSDLFVTNLFMNSLHFTYVWFYFTWQHFFTSKVFLHDLHYINCSQAIHYKNSISSNGLRNEKSFTFSIVKTFCALNFSHDTLLLLMVKFSWSTVARYTLYVDQRCAGINCSMNHGITNSNHASKISCKTRKYVFQKSLKTDQKY